MIFPALAALAEEIGVELLDDGVVVLRGLPRSGRTTVVERVAELLGTSVFLVRGRSIGDASYRSRLEVIESELATRVESLGHAQLLVDDFGLVMRQTFGHAFQAALRALIVDGALASRAGALLTASLGDPITAPRRHGSPFVAHARIRFVPWLSAADYSQRTTDIEEQRALAALCGSNVALLDRVNAGFAAARAFADLQLTRWLADLSQAELELLLAAADGPMAYQSDHDRLTPLLTRNDGAVRLIAAVSPARLQDARIGPWPTTISLAAERLALRIGDEPLPLWLDRYLGTHPAELAALIGIIAPLLAPRKLRLLASADGVRNAAKDPVALRGAIAAASAAGLQVIWRLIDHHDFTEAHARWLVLPGTGTVYIVPPEDRVLGVSALGNEGDVVTTGDFTIAEGFWARSQPFTF